MAKSVGVCTSCFAIALVATGIAAITLAGCANYTYRAEKLPAELAATPAPDITKINLANVASTTLPNDVIAPGDVLDVVIITDVQDRYVRPVPIRVCDDGSIVVPIVGRVYVAGLTLEDAERAIANAAVERGIYRNPAVTVTMNKRKTNRITVVGAVRKEGVYELPRGQSNLLAALVAAGNLTDEADPRIEVRRSRPNALENELQRPPTSTAATERVKHASYERETANASGHVAGAQGRSFFVDLTQPNVTPAAVELQDGDIVVVPRRPPRSIYVTGLVNRPGKFELPAGQDVRLLDAIAMAGGQVSSLADTVYVIRQLPQTDETVTIRCSIRRAKSDAKANIVLADGDVVSVEENVFTWLERVGKYLFRFAVSGSVRVF